MSFSYLNELFPSTRRNIDNEIKLLTLSLNHLYKLTQDEFFKNQTNVVHDFLHSLPDDKCEAWNINKKLYNIRETEAPHDSVFAIVQQVGDDHVIVSKRLLTNLNESKKEAQECIRNFHIDAERLLDQTRQPSLFKVTLEKIEH
jgi:hypothetical protein